MTASVASWIGDDSERRISPTVTQIRLLGGVEVLGDAGESIDVGPAKCQALLAALALAPGSVVPVHRLVELVWGDHPPRTADKTLQSYATRLRKALGPTSIERIGSAYRLQIGPSSVDVIRFQDHLAAGQIDAALAEWAGTPLAGLDAPGLTGAVDRLIEQWFGAVEADLERAVEDDPASSIAHLTELAAEHPFREGIWALLMTALYRSGRQADALDAYRRARSHLVEGLGVEPGPRLRELEARILGQDEQLITDTAAQRASRPPTGTVTFAFGEIEGSPTLWTAHRQAMASAVARHDELVTEITIRNEGFVFSTGGDSFGVAFHRAADAARWATELHAAIGAEPWPDTIELRIRIGLHTGEAEERANDYFGSPVNLASRIADAAHGGQTLLSGSTAGLLDQVELAELGLFRFDGMASGVRLFQVGHGQHPRPRTEDARKGNLPRRTARLLGRETALEEVTAAMVDRPVVTLVGPGGIGKTCLALAAAHEVADRLADGAHLVELADIAESADIARSVADVLDLSERLDRTGTDSIISQLESREMLLVLDNCEHVIDGVAELVVEIVAACPGVAVLATSREGLGVPDERLVPVGPLAITGPAVELFQERARAVGAPLDVDSDRPAIEEICRRLDGVPLAIELTAARARTLTPADLVDRLDDRFRLLSAGRRRSVERHRTLRATIQWSHDLLTAEEQVLFRRLSVFAGTFDLHAAETVTGDDEVPADAVNGLLDDLVGRSMVVVESGPRGRRFRLLETMRQFGAELLAEADAGDRMAARHAQYVADEVGRIGVTLMSRREIDGAARLAELWPNVRAALEWTLAVQDRALAASIIEPIAFQMFVRRGYGEIAAWIERLLVITPPEDRELRSRSLMWLALHYSMNQRGDRLQVMLERYGDPDDVLVRYAHLVGVADDHFGVLDVGPMAAAEMRRRGDETYARLFEMFTAAATMMAGRLAEAEAKLQDLASWFEAQGPPSVHGWTQFLLGSAALFAEDHERTETHWARAAAIEVPPRTNSPSETLSARSAARAGRHAEAARILRAYVDDLVEADNMAGVAMLGIEFVNLVVADGLLAEAAVVLGHFDATGLLGVEGPGFKVMIEEAVERVTADPDAAAERARSAREELDEHGALGHMSRVLDEMIAEGRRRQA